MSPADTPTTAPALTDEQIDELTETVRADFVASAADEDEIRADHETFARWYAAVVARAKREAAEEIAQAIESKRAGDRAVDARITGPTPEYRVGHADGLTDAAVIARGIGAAR